MERFKVIKNLGYGICLNSCGCRVFNKRQGIYKNIKRGCLAIFQYRECGQNRSVLTLVTNNNELYVPEFLCYKSIEPKLFKYLNAINDFEDRVKFYMNKEQRRFVLQLEKNSDVSVGFSGGKLTLAIFRGITENKETIFITVESLERPRNQYALPANMVHTIAALESSQNDNRGSLACLLCLPRPTRNYDNSNLEPWRCYNNVQNVITSDVSRTKSVFNNVDPAKEKLISQNPGSSVDQKNYHDEPENYHVAHKNVTLDKSYKKASNGRNRDDFTRKPVGRNAKPIENHSKTRSLPTDLLSNSGVCYMCSSVCEGNICRTCDNQPKNIFDQNNSQTNIDSNISLVTGLSIHEPIKSRVCAECSKEYEGNICRNCVNQTINISGQNNSQINVGPNIPAVTSLSNRNQIKSRICPECSNVCEGNICRSCDNQPKNIFDQTNFQTKIGSNISSVTSLSNHKPIKSRVCSKCSNESEGNICRTCDNQSKNISGQNNSKTKVDSNIPLVTGWSIHKPMKPIVCPECSNVRDGNICRTCDNQPKNIFGQNDFQTNVVPNIPAVTNLTIHKPIKPRVCPKCSTEFEGDVCRTCDNQPTNNYGQNDSQTNTVPNIPAVPNLTIQKPIISRKCTECLNECEGNIRHTCDNQPNKFFAQNNSQTNFYSNKSFDRSLSPDTPINPELCVGCSNVYEGDSCPSCGMNKIFDQNNSQIKVDSTLLSDTSLSNESPLTSLKINTHVTSEDDLPDNIKVAVRRNISASNCIICKNHLDTFEGFILMLCKHTFCETCIKKQINLERLEHTNIMPCCDRLIELDEIKYFLYNHEYEQFKARNTQQCFDKNCTGFLLLRECGLTCNKCKLDNSLKCEAIHVNLTCEQYDKITGDESSVDKETAEMFLTWIREGIAMPCPKCEALIEKDEGCDWVQCPFCNIEICWATHGPRWGPDGKGDTSGGCGCDFKVKKCVETCNYCH